MNPSDLDVKSAELSHNRFSDSSRTFARAKCFPLTPEFQLKLLTMTLFVNLSQSR